MGGGSFAASILGYVGGELGTNWVFIVAAGFGILALVCTVFLLIRALRPAAGGRIGARWDRPSQLPPGLD